MQLRIGNGATLGLLFTAIAIACKDTGPTIDTSPLAGLTRVQSNDTGVTAPPPGPATPGAFHGIVLGQGDWQPGTNTDTLANAPKIANARVTAYPRLEKSGTDTLGVGPAAASVLTNQNGEFQMPELPGGEYIVTFNPQAPDDLKYKGAWSIATIHSHSNDYAWWIMLMKK